MAKSNNPNLAIGVSSTSNNHNFKYSSSVYDEQHFILKENNLLQCYTVSSIEENARFLGTDSFSIRARSLKNVKKIRIRFSK